MASPRTFDQAARDYDEVRPGYPEELIEEVISVSGIPEGGRILEVGCGTGQATVPFARRGYRMLCLDVGGNLLALAEERCRAYPGAEFLNASFEEWEPGGETFDLLVSATAFHWIPPEIGFPKAARVLGDSGHIALFWNMHPRPFTGFFEEVRRFTGGSSQSGVTPGTSRRRRRSYGSGGIRSMGAGSSGRSL
jgi:ubiquinone/menaquinone biosynthesis C-methylase UbiE